MTPDKDRVTFSLSPALTGWKAYAFVACALLASSLLAVVCVHVLSPTNILMIYLIGILAVVVRTGQGPSALMCVLGVSSFDYFIISPRYSIAPTDSQYLITLAVILAVTLSISRLINQARAQNDLIRTRETQARLLFELIRELMTSQGRSDLYGTAARRIASIFHCPVLILSVREEEVPTPHGDARDIDQASWDPAIVDWVRRHRLPAGRGSQDFPKAQGLYLPILDSVGLLGVLYVEPSFDQPLRREQNHLLQALTGQVGFSAENIRLSEERREAWKAAEAERLRSSLLSSVSHDLHIPLSVIKGSASSLLDPSDGLDSDGRRQLLQGIYQESARLERFLRNLLEMTKLGAGPGALKRDEYILEELLGSVLTRLRPELRDRPVVIDLQETLPMVQVDGLLIEQLLGNLLENALKYTPDGTPIEISARVTGNFMQVDVSDRGPGLEEGSFERVFEKFYRGKRDAQHRGSGLGLAICRGVVEAHGGRIWAENQKDGGARFSFTLPLAPNRQTATPGGTQDA